LPIAVNTATSLVVFIVYTQIEVYNIRIGLLIVEVYSYSILSYGFVCMVFKQTPTLRRKIRYSSPDAGSSSVFFWWLV
jgi:hypothetical protein